MLACLLHQVLHPSKARLLLASPPAAHLLLSRLHMLQHYGPHTAGPGPSSAHAAWQAYTEAAARHAAEHAHDWRPRSRHTAVWLCGATLVAGFGVFWGALVSHEWMDGYRWLTPEVVEGRLKHPTPRRQQLMQLMVQDRQARQQAAVTAAAAEQQAAGVAD